MHGLRHASDQWEAPSWLNQCDWSAWFSKHCLFMLPQMDTFKSKELRDISSGVFRAPWTSWEKQSKSGLFGMLLVYQLKQMLSAKSGFHFSCVLLFGVQTNLSISYICPGSQFTTWQLGQIPPPHGISNGRMEDQPLTLFHWSVTIFLFSSSLSISALLLPFVRPYITFDACTVIGCASPLYVIQNCQ